MTDSITTFDVSTKFIVTSKKRLMINLQTVTGSYQNMELINVAFVLSEFMLAEFLTNARPNYLLHKVLSNGIIDHLIEQRIIKNEVVNGLDDKERESSLVGCSCRPRL